MGENDKNGTGFQSKNMEEILRERGKLDQILQKKFKKKMAILFSDVCGYTQYMDTRGDISGRAWIQKHHDIVLPLIEKYEGNVLDIMGDGVMASFSNTISAVKTAVAIQKGLDGYNQRTEPAERIHVTIGVNAGEVLVGKNHVAGDVVNVASRIESLANQDQILISKTAYEDVCGSEDILCKAHKTAHVKGKVEPLSIYRVVWRDEDIFTDVSQKVRASETKTKKKAKKPLNVLHIEMSLEGEKLSISVYEQLVGETSTVRHYEDMNVSMARIETRCQEMVETLNRANRRGRLTREVLVRLREAGQVLHDELFTLNVKEKLKETKAKYLSLNLDDKLVHVPWELLNDGHQFLCRRFNIGRFVKTRQTIGTSKTRLLEHPLKMLILADPTSDLKGAYLEGTKIRDYMDQDKNLINAALRSDGITPEFVKEKIRNFDLFHFAGHAEYNPHSPGESGLELSHGRLKAQDIIKMGGTAAMPALIFSNACQSARTEEWAIKEYFQEEIFGLANAFILAGVKHYIGTFWEILDEPSSRFALEFYKYLLSGVTIGEAIRKARLSLIKEYGEETIVWASYLLYGDPTSNYVDQIKTVEAQEKHEPARIPLSEKEIRTREEVIDFAEKEAPKKKRVRMAIGAVIIAFVIVILWGYPGVLKKDTAKYEREALTYYNDGHFDKALNVCKIIEDKNPRVRLSYLIQGNVYLRKGEMSAAEEFYQKALEAPKGTDLQKAGAFNGLGRIFSIRKKTDMALNYYRQATEVAPNSRAGYLSQALLMDDRGNHKQALDLLGKAHNLTPQDHVIAAITNETRKKVAIARDQEKQDHINQLVKELLKTMKSPSMALPSDGWTSPPLTMWIMDFTTQGYSLQEGQERLLVAGITDHLLQHSRAHLIERALLDKLLEELKLGTSGLADRNAALSLGKILAARLIFSGQAVYSGPQTQISIRLIETETGRITAAVNESFGSAMPVSILAEKLSKHLLEKLKKLYPLRGKISDATGTEIRLNIGQKAGVLSGDRFKVIDGDATLEIISVQPDTSLAKIIEAKGLLTKGMRIEGLSESK